MPSVHGKERCIGMPITEVIKNTAPGAVLCFKYPNEDFNTGAQLIVAEYEEALFMKDGVIEQVFTAGKYTLTTENFPFLTKLQSALLSGGVSRYSCKIYFVNTQHHLEQKWGTPDPVTVLDPYWQTYFQVQARGSYTVAVKEVKKFFLKFVGANAYASENDIKKNFRIAFVQNISDQLAEYITSSEEETIVICNKKKALADGVKGSLHEVLDEYGMELINFYIETIGVIEDENYLSVVKMRRERQEKMFSREQRMEEARLDFALSRERSEAERYISGQGAQADYERMKIRDQDGGNGWARQETAEILHSAAENTGAGSAFINAGIGLNVGRALGGMMADMANTGSSGPGVGSLSAPQGAREAVQSETVICPKCNAAVPKGMKFCGQCGTPVEKPKCICANCGFEIPEGMKFCGQCGTPVAKQPQVCPKCGAEVAEGMKFCGRCGNRME